MENTIKWFVTLKMEGEEKERLFQNSVNFNSPLLLAKVTEFVGNQMLDDIISSYLPRLPEAIEVAPENIEVSEPIDNVVEMVKKDPPIKLIEATVQPKKVQRKK